MRIAVVTPLFPTREEPYRGAPIWNTLRHLSALAQIDAYCTAPVPLLIRPRSSRYAASPADTCAYGIPSDTIRYFTVPVLSRPLSGRLIERALDSAMGDRQPDVILNYYLFPDGYGAVRLARRRKTRVLLGARGSDLRLFPKSPLLRRQLGNKRRS